MARYANRRVQSSSGVAVIALLLAMLLIACANDAADEEVAEEAEEVEEEAEGEPKYVIGVSLASPTIPLYVAMEEGMRDVADDLGVELRFTDADEDVVAQLDDINSLIAQEVDALLISPVDANGAIPAYEAARDAGIPAISIARSVPPEYQVAFVGGAWQDYGKTIAEWTCDELGGEGTVGMVKGPAGASFVEEKEEGYREYMESNCPGVEIIFDINMAPLTQEQGLAGGQDALTAHPDVDAIYASQDDLALGVVQAAEEAGRLGDVIITGFNGSPPAVEAIRQGQLSMTIALRPYNWAIEGLEAVIRMLDGEELPPIVDIETLVVDVYNVEDITPEDLR